MRRLLQCLMTALLGYSLSAWALEPDIFGTAHSVSRQAVYDDARGELSCSFGRLPERLPLEQVVERILCHDPQTRISWANAKAQAAQVGLSQSAYLPSLNGRIGTSRGNGRVDYDESYMRSGEGHRRRNSASLELNWVLVDFGRRGAALRNARQLLLAANATQDATLQSTFVQAAQAYYDALSAQRSLAASVQIAELAARNLEAADAKYKAGAAALSDRLQAQTAFSQANLRQIRDRGALRNALGVIALRMGLPPETPLQLAGDLTPLPDTQFVKAVDELLIQARQDHPAVLAANARLNAAQAAVDEKRAAGLPSLALTADLTYTQSQQSKIFNGDERERDRSIGLQLSIALFEGFGRTYQVRNAQARVEASQAELAEVEQQVALDLWASYQTLNIETQSLQRTNELVDQSRQSLEVVQGRYHSGVGSMIELLNALTAYAGAEEQHIQTLSHWQTSRLRLAASLGRLGFWTLQ
ncbi:TolC family protein [Pseudomonas sp. ADAK18]|uniref:TolC family protein n=1 Tax=Pseudomonas sp. ADAK18 TaxID=2730848 RepID=UPI00146436FF|nr:TolC family protein [Pseudomonas sp. ADAK18]QJI30067.1 TolC family protein [Pseudomonas sp. ADAK18]